MQNSQISVGTTVIFKGFSEESETPDFGEYLQEGREYTIDSINNEDNPNEETSYNVVIPNPSFDSSKRASKKNLKEIKVDLYADEIEIVDEGAGITDTATDIELDMDKLSKGDYIRVVKGDESYNGEVVKNTKTLLGISHDGVEIDFKKKDISAYQCSLGLTTLEAQEEEVREEKPKAKAKTKTETKEKLPSKTKSKKSGKQTKAESKKTKDGKAGKEKSQVSKENQLSESTEEKDHSDIIVLTDEEDDQDILELVKSTEDILGLARDLAEDSAHLDYRLGGVLYHIHRSKAYKELGDEYTGVKGFEKYIDDQMDIGYRKAMYLIKIYAKWNKYGLDKNKVAEIGWTKAQQIASVMDEDNAEQLVELAEDNTVSELKEAIKESFSRVGEDTREVIKKITFKFRLVEDAGDAISNYIEMAGQQLGLTKPEDIFEHIVTEWAQEHLDISKKKR